MSTRTPVSSMNYVYVHKVFSGINHVAKEITILLITTHYRGEVQDQASHQAQLSTFLKPDNIIKFCCSQDKGHNINIPLLHSQ
jgi:translation elongation factor EF-1alpha